MYDMPLDAETDNDYLMFVFASEFGYTPAQYEALTLDQRQRLRGVLAGYRIGLKHRRGDYSDG
jgi:hypothetical protein